MRNFFKLIAVVLVVVCANNFASAQQKLKIGHVNSAELLQVMPGRDSAQKALEVHAKSLEKSLMEMQSEIEAKYQKYQGEQANMNQIVKESKQKELQDLQKRLEDFQASAQQDVQKKEQELVQPILDKAKKAIEEVAKENGFTYVLDTSAGAVLYSEKGDDLMPLVKKKLNIK